MCIRDSNKAREIDIKAKWYHINTEKMRVSDTSRVKIAIVVKKIPGNTKKRGFFMHVLLWKNEFEFYTNPRP